MRRRGERFPASQGLSLCSRWFRGNPRRKNLASAKNPRVCASTTPVRLTARRHFFSVNDSLWLLLQIKHFLLHCFLCFHKVIEKNPYLFTGIPNLKELPRLDLSLFIHHPTNLSSFRLCVLPERSGLVTAALQLGSRERE